MKAKQHTKENNNLDELLNEDATADVVEHLKTDEEVFIDAKYICASTNLITDSLKKGFDIVQFGDGEVMVTEVKVVNVFYAWDKTKQKMVITRAFDANL